MDTKFIEAYNVVGGKPFNWGKFLVGRFTAEEWERRCAAPGIPPVILLDAVGWTPRHITVIDLQLGEGAIFKPGGLAEADLDKKRIKVCPLFQPFLEWLYKQDLSNLDALPTYVELPDAPAALKGYRRGGPQYGGREES